MNGTCECGCGVTTGVHKQSDSARGYVKGAHARFAPGHNAKNKDGKSYRLVSSASGTAAVMLEHRVIVERVLGRALDIKHEIHHVNNNRRDNRNANLVVCQDKAYHKLLHARARIVAAGGDPNTERLCSRCRMVLPVAAFGRSSQRQLGTQTACKLCGNKYRQSRKIGLVSQ